MNKFKIHYFSENIRYIISWNMKRLKKYFSDSPSEIGWIVWGCFWKFRLQCYLYSLFLNNILQIRRDKTETGPNSDLFLCKNLGTDWKEWQEEVFCMFVPHKVLPNFRLISLIVCVTTECKYTQIQLFFIIKILCCFTKLAP